MDGCVFYKAFYIYYHGQYYQFGIFTLFLAAAKLRKGSVVVKGNNLANLRLSDKGQQVWRPSL